MLLEGDQLRRELLEARIRCRVAELRVLAAKQFACRSEMVCFCTPARMPRPTLSPIAKMPETNARCRTLMTYQRPTAPDAVAPRRPGRANAMKRAPGSKTPEPK
jgi:hypothetical protein